MSDPQPAVVYEDNHLLIIDKPVLLATMGTGAGEPSAVDWGKDYLKRKYHKPGNVFLGVVSRVDSFVSGLVPFARTSKAASRLSRAFAEHKVDKVYLAIVAGSLSHSTGVWTDWLEKNDAARQMQTRDKPGGSAKQARLAYRVLADDGERSLVAIRLETGRKHQIRVQFASRGHEILGDAKYGARPVSGFGIALHCAHLALPHPTQDRLVVVTSSPPERWRRFWPSLPAVWDGLDPSQGRLGIEFPED